MTVDPAGVARVTLTGPISPGSVSTLVDLRAETKIYNGSNNLFADTKYNYDKVHGKQR